MDIFIKNDNENEKSLKMPQNVKKNINCYKEAYLMLKQNICSVKNEMILVKNDNFR